MSASAIFTKVPADSLFVSEPDPSWFGNGRNEPGNKHWTNGNWLKSRFHFSFAEYHDRTRMGFGPLRVMNDDLVQPQRGFGTHPHRNMEIVTYVLEGKLTHQDSMGTKESLGRGSIQFMTAGTGVRHSEFNSEEKDPLRFIQIWIQPRTDGLTPNYGSMCGDGKEEMRKGQWAHLVSDVSDDSVRTPVEINQDANIRVTELDPGASVNLELADGRIGYLLCMEGSASLASKDAGLDESLARHDAARLYGPTAITVTATEAEDSKTTHLLLVEMAK